MKKTLLCFLFLFTTVFYAQITPIVHCRGDNYFDLTTKKAELIGTLNPDETTVTYYAKNTYVGDITLAIKDPSNFYFDETVLNIYAVVHNINGGADIHNSFPIEFHPVLTVSASNKPILCKGQTASLSIYVYGGQDQYQYSINGSSYTSDDHYSYLPAGNYAIKVQDVATTCTTSINYTITEPTAVVATCALDNQTAIITANGGTAPYRYSLNGIDFQAGNIFPNLASGNYIFRVMDARGCGTPVSATVLPFVNSAVAITKPLDCSSNSKASIAVTATGGESPYTYSLNGGTFQTNNTFNDLIAGTYSIVVKDAINTISNTTSIKIDPPVPVTGVVTHTIPTSCSNAFITVFANSGQSPYYYSINNGETYSNVNTFPNLQAGSTYVAFIKDSKGCVSPPLVTTIDPVQVLAATATSTAIVCEKDKATLTINAAGGQAPYKYSINNGTYSTTSTYTNIDYGTYYISVKDSVGCLATVAHTIAQPTPISSDFTVENKTLTVNGKGGTSPYQYSVDSGAYQVENIFTNLSPGNHTILVKDARGCESATFVVTVEDSIPLTASAIVTKEIDCNGKASIMVVPNNGKAPYVYSIDGGLNFQTSNVFSNLIAGTYTAAVKDSLNTVCYTNTITIAQLISVAATATITKAVNCGDKDIVTVTVGAGKAPYLYSFDGAIFTAENTAIGLTAGNHSIIVKDANGCTATFPVTIEPSSLLSASFTTTDVNCSQGRDGIIVLNAKGGTAPYTYSIGNGNVSSNIFNGLSAGIYNLSVKDATGCIFTMVATIVEPTPLLMTASTTNSTTAADNDGTITVNATGELAPYSYKISQDGLPASSLQTSNIFAGLKSGSYGVQVIDAKGCTYLHTNITIINNLNSLVVSVFQVPATCNNPTGTITANATGGLPPYQYSFDGTDYLSANVFTASPGTYSVKVRDAENNIATIYAVIAPLNPPTALTATLISNVLCKGGNTGSIEINTIAGVAPYSYSLDNGPYITSVGNSMIFANLYAGTHDIKVMDANGCYAIAQIPVSEPATALMTVTTVKNQTITINASGGSGTIKYAISPNLDQFSTNNVFSKLIPASYTVITQDMNGCYIQMNALVDPPAPLINGQIKLTLEFKPGQTLADLIIDGQNIKWYINQNPLSGKTSKTSETPLPLTTVIEDGTTYYASQTVNGIESTERLAVTVKSGTLGTDAFVIKDLAYYPNPVENILTISNTSVIDEVKIISVKGETLLTKQINNVRSEIDLSNFSSGIYLLKVKSEGSEKTVKIIKK